LHIWLFEIFEKETFKNKKSSLFVFVDQILKLRKGARANERKEPEKYLKSKTYNYQAQIKYYFCEVMLNKNRKKKKKKRNNWRNEQN
jgi:hypothetical protein